MVMLKFIEWFKNNDLVVNVLKLVTGTAIGQLITILISPLLTRIYTPDDFGILAIYVSIVSILGVIISLRFETAIMLPEREEEAVALVILSSTISLLISIGILLVVLSFNQALVELIGHKDFSVYLYFIPLSTFFFGGFQILSFWVSRVRNFNTLAISKTTKETATAITQLTWGGFLYSGATGLIAGQIAGNAVASGMLFTHSIKRLIIYLKSDTLKNLKNVFIKYKQFPLYTSWATLINAFSQNIPTLLLAFFFSPAAAGFYAIASRVVSIPTIMIGNSVRQVYYQKASTVYNKGSSIYPIFKKTTLQLLLLAIFPFTLIIFLGETLFSFVLGASWAEAGTYASILSLWLFFSFINPPSVMSLFILKFNKVHLIWEILLLLFRVVAISVGFYVYNDVIVSLGYYALVGIIFNVFLIGLIYYKLKN